MFPSPSTIQNIKGLINAHITAWVKTKPGTDQPDAFVNNHHLDGTDRVKEDESND